MKYEIVPSNQFKKDLKLAQALIKGGSEHRKFLRQIFVTVDITAPLYFWKEFDTYKVGTVANSCSTMHKIHARPIERGDFSCDRLDEGGLAALEEGGGGAVIEVGDQIIPRADGGEEVLHVGHLEGARLIKTHIPRLVVIA